MVSVGKEGMLTIQSNNNYETRLEATILSVHYLSINLTRTDKIFVKEECDKKQNYIEIKGEVLVAPLGHKTLIPPLLLT